MSNNIVGVIVFLAEAADEVDQEEELNEVVEKELVIGDIFVSKSGIVGVNEGIVARCEEHEVVEHRFVDVLATDNNLVEEVVLALAGDLVLLATLFVKTTKLI